MTANDLPVGRRRFSFRIALDVVATLASVIAVGEVLWLIVIFPIPAPQAQRFVPAVPAEPVSLEGAPTLGSATAPVVMLEFSDFECPFCAKFVKETWPEIKAAYVDSGQVQVVFRHLPLAIHKRAERAAQAAVCAAEQGRFWALHDELFGAGGRLEGTDLTAYARRSGLSAAPFDGCMAGPSAERVKQDLGIARSLELSGTPAFLIGKRQEDGRLKVTNLLFGARQASEFREAFQSATAGREGRAEDRTRRQTSREVTRWRAHTRVRACGKRKMYQMCTVRQTASAALCRITVHMTTEPTPRRTSRIRGVAMLGPVAQFSPAQGTSRRPASQHLRLARENTPGQNAPESTTVTSAARQLPGYVAFWDRKGS